MSRKLFFLACGAIALAAGIFSYLCGQRGFFALDQSIVFDGGFRVLHGQLPYRDFSAPHGMLLYLLQGGVFALFGVSYTAYLVFGAVQAALATVMSAAVVRELAPERAGPALMAALITATWFYAPFGTPYPEQSAMLLLLFVIWLIMRARHRGLFIGGVLFVCAALTKQNLALFSLPLVGGLLLTGAKEWRAASGRFARFTLGVTLGVGALLAYLVAINGTENFVRALLVLPGELAAHRFRDLSQHLLTPTSLLLMVSLLGVLLIAVWVRMRMRPDSELRGRGSALLSDHARQASATVVLGGLLLLSFALRETTFNNPALASLNLGLTLGTTWALWRSTGVPFSTLEGAIVGVVTLSSLSVGALLSWNRLAQESVANSHFEHPLRISGFESLRWGSPTQIEGRQIPAADIEAVVKVLKERSQSFFVFPDHTILYAMVGIPSQQPFLWFHPGLTYRPGRMSGDALITRLREQEVDHIVVEQASFLGTAERMGGFEGFEVWLTECFEVAESHGVFTIFRRTSPSRQLCERMSD